MWLRVLWAGLLAAPGVVAAAPALATTTILDGQAVLIREASKMALVEGVRLKKGDIIESGAQGKFVRMEFADGTMLDIGPETRILIAPQFSGRPKRPPVKAYLLQGWAKVTAPKVQAASTTPIAAAAFDVSSLTRQIVLDVQPNEAYAFVESGEATLQERINSRPVGAVTLKSDQFFGQADSARATITMRPSAKFIQSVPRPFQDSLPTRSHIFKDNEVVPKLVSTINYADVQAWIDTEPSLRGQFVYRWRAQAGNPEFRKGLIANLNAHPEWDRTLFPEKYLPKPTAGDTYRHNAQR